MANYKQPFKERVKDTTSEDKFEANCRENGLKFYKYGIDNHPFGKELHKVYRFVRNTPDYIVMGSFAYFVEVKGCRDIVKIKEQDLYHYKEWNNKMPLHFYFYSSTWNESKVISYNKLSGILPSCETGYYPDATKYDDKMYYKINWRDLC